MYKISNNIPQNNDEIEKHISNQRNQQKGYSQSKNQKNIKIQNQISHQIENHQKNNYYKNYNNNLQYIQQDELINDITRMHLLPPHCPLKQSLLRYLARHRRVVFINEYRTSKCCAVCDQLLRQVSNRYVQCTSAGEREHVRGIGTVISFLCCHPQPSREKVCDSEGCGGGNVLVNRDVNAALNIAKLFQFWIDHHDRPAHLKPKPKPTSDAAAAPAAPAPSESTLVGVCGGEGRVLMALGLGLGGAWYF